MFNLAKQIAALCANSISTHFVILFFDFSSASHQTILTLLSDQKYNAKGFEKIESVLAIISSFPAARIKHRNGDLAATLFKMKWNWIAGSGTSFAFCRKFVQESFPSTNTNN
ncbi:hypothetical protein ACHWQZ_G014026 [Mnemiopsis leidyi]